MSILRGLEDALAYAKGDTTRGREVTVTVPDSAETAAPAHKVSIRPFEHNTKIPEQAQEELLTNLDNTIDTYLAAIGCNKKTRSV